MAEDWIGRRGWGPWAAAASGVVAGLSGVAAPNPASRVVVGALTLAALAPVWAAWEVAQGLEAPPGFGPRLRAALPGWSVGAGVVCGAVALSLGAGGPSRAGLALAAGAATLLVLFALGCRAFGLAVSRIGRSRGLGAAFTALFGGVALALPVLIAPWAGALAPSARSALLRASPLTAFPEALAGVDLLKSEALYRLCAYAQTHGYSLPASAAEASLAALWLVAPAALLCVVVVGRRRQRSP